MPPMRRIATYLRALIGAALVAGPAQAAEATVAVATNFLSTAQGLEAAFEAQGDDRIRLAHGSTGRLFAQIVTGAPFDLFLAADAARADALEARGLVAARRTYALGQLVLVSRGPVTLPDDLYDTRIAMADPAVAPYGLAATEALAELGADRARIDMVFGDSVGQVASIFVTGNADLAFLALSQVPDLGAEITVTPMAGRHAPVRQDAVLLTRGTGNSAAEGFYRFLSGPEGRALIEAAGYEVPE